MDLILASNNPNKVKEFIPLLSPWKLYLPNDEGLQFDHDEIGQSFLENALGKALSLYNLLAEHTTLHKDYAILADDSGLVIPALGGEPGIYSARYGKELDPAPKTDQARNQLVLERLRTAKDRSAYYVACLVLLKNPQEFISVQEVWQGQICRQEAKGPNGFAYDSIFCPAGQEKSAAQLAQDFKNTYSHRAKACKRLLHLYPGY